MAAGMLPKPGTKYGPCKGECAHKDCATTRAEAAQICRVCKEEIGYGVRFYNEAESGERKLIHANCLEYEIES